jgi:hypothetical protein
MASGSAYIETEPGCGYRLAADVNIDMGRVPVRPLPTSPTKVIGREAVVAALLTEFPNRRLVTIVGPGGIGKTTVALVAARELIDARVFAAVELVDFSTFRGPHRGSRALRSALAPTAQGQDDWQTIRAALRE